MTTFIEYGLIGLVGWLVALMTFKIMSNMFVESVRDVLKPVMLELIGYYLGKKKTLLDEMTLKVTNSVGEFH